MQQLFVQVIGLTFYIELSAMMGFHASVTPQHQTDITLMSAYQNRYSRLQSAPKKTDAKILG
jgi:hypothetical protein